MPIYFSFWYSYIVIIRFKYAHLYVAHGDMSTKIIFCSDKFDFYFLLTSGTFKNRVNTENNGALSADNTRIKNEDIQQESFNYKKA